VGNPPNGAYVKETPAVHRDQTPPKNPVKRTWGKIINNFEIREKNIGVPNP